MKMQSQHPHANICKWTDIACEPKTNIFQYAMWAHLNPIKKTELCTTKQIQETVNHKFRIYLLSRHWRWVDLPPCPGVAGWWLGETRCSFATGSEPERFYTRHTTWHWTEYCQKCIIYEYCESNSSFRRLGTHLHRATKDHTHHPRT